MMKRTICNSLQTPLARRCLQALFALLLGLSGNMSSAKAADGVEIASVRLIPGRTQQVAIRLNNEADYTAFQLDLYLPDGVTLDNSTSPQGMSLSTRANSNHTLTASEQPDGSIRIVCYSSQNNAFTGTSGNLIILQLAVAEGVTESCTIQLKNIIFTTTAIKEVKFQDVTAILEVNEGGYTPGDVNGDGRINVMDIQLIINKMFRRTLPVNFIEAAADVNGDGRVNVMDIQLVINKMFNRQ
ncbi:MAG: hypothetical protein J6I36_07000 [Bacteroidaceae bacterium]|nr:hypothetical protein [Bacteroidaceae bacterium]